MRNNNIHTLGLTQKLHLRQITITTQASHLDPSRLVQPPQQHRTTRIFDLLLLRTPPKYPSTSQQWPFASAFRNLDPDSRIVSSRYDIVYIVSY